MVRTTHGDTFQSDNVVQCDDHKLALYSFLRVWYCLTTCDTRGAGYLYENRTLLYEVELELTSTKNNAGRLLRFERKHDLYLHAGKGQYNPRVEFCCAKRAAHVEFCGEITDNQDTMQTRWRTHVLIRKNHQICPHLQKCSSSGHQVHPKVNYHETRQVMSRESFSKRRCRCQHEKRFKPHFDEV